MPRDYQVKLWEVGQNHLAAGRYSAARRELETAARLAVRCHDAAALGRICLPLLEACRQIRQNAVEGPILIGGDYTTRQCRVAIHRLFTQSAGTLVIGTAGRLAHHLEYRAWGGGGCFEVLGLIEHSQGTRLVAPAACRWVDGLEVLWTADSSRLITPAGAATAENLSPLVVPLPSPGLHLPGTLCHAQARESLLEAWEALALRWMYRRSLPRLRGWTRIATLLAARQLDPAAEPVLMEVLAVAERIEHS